MFEPDGPLPVTLDRREVYLAGELSYRGQRDVFVIPAGFGTDFASVPRFATWLVPTMGVYTLAAILHDYLCTLLHGELPWPPGLVLTGADADGLLRRVARELGTPAALAWLMWAGVRWDALLVPARRSAWLSTLGPLLVVTLCALPLAPLLLTAMVVGWFVPTETRKRS